MPDIDLDFRRDIRKKLMLRVYEHFGATVEGPEHIKREADDNVPVEKAVEQQIAEICVRRWAGQTGC